MPLFSCRFDRPAFLPVFGAVPAMLVVEDLVASGLSLELHDKNGLYTGSFAGGRTCVDALNGYTFGEEVELAQDSRFQISNSRFLI